MKRLELTKGRSYSTKNFSCVMGKPVLVSDEQAEELMKTGRFVTVGGVVETAPPADPVMPEPTTPDDEPDQDEDGQEPEPAAEENLSADGIAKMKKNELIELAQKHNIDISECNNNSERAEKICGMLGLASTVQLGLE